VNSIEWLVFLLNLVPFLELRLALPFAIAAGYDPLLSLVVCIGLNLLVAPLAFGILDFLVPPLRKRWKVVDKLYRWSLRRVKKHERLGAFGLFLLVGIPLPGTGAYAGALVAHISGMKRKFAYPAIVGGVVLAGLLLWSLASLGVIFIQGISSA